MDSLLDRLERTDPGWPVWRDLVALARSLRFEVLENDWLGSFYVAGERLVFKFVPESPLWPAWTPPYVRGLYGLKATNWEWEGGYAGALENQPVQAGYLMDPSGTIGDESLGYPLIRLDKPVYAFQANVHGTRFHINQNLDVLYLDSEREKLEVLDSLERFSQRNIEMALENRGWYEAYVGVEGLEDL